MLRVVVAVGAVLVAASVSATAHAGARWASADVSASSVKPGSKAQPERYTGWRAIDNDTATAWCEGAPGNGVGEALTITFTEPTAIGALELTGRGASPPTALDLSFDGGTARRVALVRGYASAKLDVTATTVRIAIAAAKGARHGDACLDLAFDGLGVFVGEDPAFQALPGAVSALFAGISACDATALTAIGSFPLARRTTVHGPGKSSNRSRFRDGAALARACKRKQLSRLQPDGWPDGNCGLAAPGSVDCIGVGPDSRWVMSWTDGSWKLVSVSEDNYTDE